MKGTKPARPRRPRWAKVLIAVGIALAVLAGAGIGGFKILSERYDRAVSKADLLDGAARNPDGTLRGPLNYLLVGSDERAANPSMGQRADSIVIVSIPEGLHRAYLISVPRDLKVDIPPDPASGYAGGSDKINAAFQYGRTDGNGAKLLSATVSNLTGIRFDGAAIVDFTGFRQVVDLLGGVDLCIDQQVTSRHTGRVFTVGCRTMTGDEALDFARQRYGLPDGDFDRQRHQQQLLKAIAQKLTAPSVLANPVKFDQTVRAIGATLTVDTNGVPLQDIVVSMRHMRANDIIGVKMPAVADNVDGISYDKLVEPQAQTLFQALRESRMAEWVAANPQWVNSL